MANSGCLILFISVLFQIIGCVLAQKSKFANVNPALFTWKDADVNKNCSASVLESSSLRVTHIQGKCSPFRNPNSTWWSAMLESINGDEQRYRAIMKRSGRLVKTNSKVSPQEDADVPLASGTGGANYIIKLDFGTPAQSFYLDVDTGSDITWIPCAPCSTCSTPVFTPSKSSTYKFLTCASKPCQDLGICGNDENANCSIVEQYGDQSEVDQLLSSETLSVSSQSVKEFVFGCAYSLTGLIQSTPGLVGFGRDSLSFVSQTADLYDKTFSYCLPSLGSSAFTGSLRLGKGALSAPGLQFTPLLSNAQLPSFYFLGLSGISVGEERVSIPAGTFATGKGTIIDSGTVITRLVEPAYNAMRDSFRRQLSNLSLARPLRPFDTCYKGPSGDVKFPVITLHFENSVDLTLPLENTLYPANAKGSVLCLAFALPPAVGDSVVSIIGNYQQQNFRIVHDVPGSRLGIAPENCDT